MYSIVRESSNSPISDFHSDRSTLSLSPMEEEWCLCFLRLKVCLKSSGVASYSKLSAWDASEGNQGSKHLNNWQVSLLNIKKNKN